MGTRSQIQVIDKDGNIKISQYAQWDGYPEGQGADVFNLLKEEGLQEKLQAQLPKCVFYDEHIATHVAFAKDFDTASAGKTLSLSQKEWRDKFLSRDVGANILKNVAETKIDGPLILQECTIEPNDVWIEFRHIVNFQDNTFKIIEGSGEDIIMQFDITALPDQEEFNRQEQAWQALISDDEE